MRDVAIVDAKGVCSCAKIDEFLLVKMKGSQVDVACRIHKDYEKCATVENGERVLCMMLNYGSHGTLQRALLWCEMLTSKLIENSFAANAHDSCVANKIVDGSQCTIAFHTGDAKMSHEDPGVVTGAIDMLESEFGKLVTSRGKSHNFLDMDVVFLDDGRTKLQMKGYLVKAIEACGKGSNMQNAS